VSGYGAAGLGDAPGDGVPTRPVAGGAMTAVGEGPAGVGTDVADAPQAARLAATSVGRRTSPARRRRAWAGITGPLTRGAERIDRVAGDTRSPALDDAGEDQPVGIMPACPFLARVRAALPRGRRPDFRRC
jgi:hypothetical protein